MAAPLLSLQGVSARFGGRTLFEGIDLHLLDGDRLCLVGRNGSGKSTLLQIAAGALDPGGGTRVARAGVRVAYVPQEPAVEPDRSVLEQVAAALPPDRAAERYAAEALVSELGLDPDQRGAVLSGGERRRLSIAQALVTEPDVLLLDEPTNHLDLPTIEWLEQRLGAFRGAFVLISHDRAFLERLTRGILWLDRGQLRRHPDKGFAAFDAWSAALLEADDRELDKLEKRFATETQWSREGISARRTRNQGRLRRLHALRAERRARPDRAGDVKLAAQRGALSGKEVIRARGLTKRFGDRVIVDGFSTTIERGDRVGVIGPNGAGKTTLIRLLMGSLAPDAGETILGTNLTPLVIDQHRADLDPDRSVWDALVEEGTDQVMVHGRPRHVMGYLKDFLFQPAQAHMRTGELSGGERNRLVLARELARPSNLLVLDEPTNDLDMETLEVLTEVLAGYPGTVLLVSHDRDFLDRVVTSTIALEGDGRAVEYAGGYTDFLQQKQAAEATARPTAASARANDPGPARREKKAQTKLTYGQNRELAELTERIAAIQGEIADLEVLLNDPAAYARDAAAFTAASERLPLAKGDLADAEERWLELEMLREELEG